jgi:predicted TIM-barrel fold metal-dependent hydrolase
MCSQESFTPLRLRVTAEADPSAIGRVIERFQNLNIVLGASSPNLLPTICCTSRSMCSG